jgi:hypothetical protein
MKYTVELENYWSMIDITNTPFIPVGGLAACIDQEKDIIYLFGGMGESSEKINGLYKFDLSNNEITKLFNVDINERINHKMYFIGNNKICIVGGYDYKQEAQPKTIEIILVDITNSKFDLFDTGIDFRAQFGSAYDKHSGSVYLYNGFGKNDFWCIHLLGKQVHKIEINQAESRAGMVCEYLQENKFFIFSGFSKNNEKAKCHNDIIFINTKTNEITKHDLNEPFGRTFSKSVIIEELNKILFYGGSVNGMESSGSLYFYDYKTDLFNVAYIQPLPGERVESAMIYSKNKKKVYIIGGLQPQGRSYKAYGNMMVLDLTLVGNEVWLGHP